ncbi:hypothetical protein JI735_34115 (plasmid) [Paenibacillus sonchi]|uniref:Uncharacterized protein n=1 Tax=Paenibacillus sonchi TaxID=373687 RepID=A0A974PJK7_9BACL|nr:hypothetical protein [Paenibacillus sonchi]QQZ64477.1 hypothetical protein JI735_34115 [Paenibacillus sonchi]
MENTLSLQILFEEDKADMNVSAYIPGLGLQIIGDTIEEARENAKDSVHAELEKEMSIGKAVRLAHSIVQYIDSFSVLYEDVTSDKVSAYVPALRLGVCGKDLTEAEENVKELIGVEIEKLRLCKRSVPKDTAVYEFLTVQVPVIS